MLGVSSWLLLLFVPGAVVAWLGFAIIGGLVVRVRWIIAAAVYLTLVLILNDLVPRDLRIFGALALQAAAITHGLISNSGWLALLWGRRERGQRMLGRGLPVSKPVPRRAPAKRKPAVATEATALLEQTGVRSDDFFEPAPVLAPVDVNTAPLADLVALPGVTAAAAKRAVAQRAKEPFGSTQDFADAVGLKPHEFAKLREQLVCTVVRAPRPRGGRRIDL